MENPLTDLLRTHADRVRAVLNVLLESPYFYRSDNQELFYFLRRHRPEFARFYEDYYGWSLVMDAKCARVFKPTWYNEAVTEANRDLFDFRRRDECLAFMILLEFFEHQLDENAMTVEEQENVRFRFGDLLRYTCQRFQELFPEDGQSRYAEDLVRGTVLRRVLPTLEKYRFVKRIRPPHDLELGQADMIFEALPALYHYNAHRLSAGVEHLTQAGEEDAPDTGARPETETDENDE